MFLLDVERSGGSARETAAALRHSVDRMFFPDSFRFAGGTTDAAGGGPAFTREMAAFNLVNKEQFLEGFCALHGLQLVLKDPIEESLGENGMGKRTALQLIHNAYDISNALETDVWKSYVKKASENLGIPMLNKRGEKVNTPPTMQEAVLTRWWTVGDGAQINANNILLFIEAIKQAIIHKRKNADDKAMKIANDYLSLITEGSIVSDVMLINGFMSFFDPHFAWFQKGDPRVGNTPALKSRLVLVRMFLINEDLEKLANDNSWEEEEAYTMFVETLLHQGIFEGSE